MLSTGTSSGQVTALLKRWTKGDDAALQDLIPLIYADLKRIAERALRRERPGHILQPTALVNEAYLQLAAENDRPWQNRAHFVAIAACVMRRVLVDYARERRRKKRGGGAQLASLETAVGMAMENPQSVLLLDYALTRLSQEHPRKGRLVEMHSFGGLTLAEAAEILGISENTAQRDFKFAKAWISRELGYQYASQKTCPG
jgi:RNA polymerase sigma-70 factor, ECF subfamily